MKEVILTHSSGSVGYEIRRIGRALRQVEPDDPDSIAAKTVKNAGHYSKFQLIHTALYAMARGRSVFRNLSYDKAVAHACLDRSLLLSLLLFGSTLNSRPRRHCRMRRIQGRNRSVVM